MAPSSEQIRANDFNLNIPRYVDTFEAEESIDINAIANPGEKFIVTTFDDPRSSKPDLMAARSGRLYIIRFPESINLESRFEAAQPGSLGMSLYTYRVKGIQEYCDRIKASTAKKVTNIISNEFGEISFSFVAPDGYFWTLLDS